MNAKKIKVDAEELNLMTSVLLEYLQTLDNMEELEHTAEKWHLVSEIKISEPEASMQESLRQYRKRRILEFLDEHEGKKYDRKDLMEYSGVTTYELLYSYVGEMILDSELDFDMSEWGEYPMRMLEEVKEKRKQGDRRKK